MKIRTYVTTFRPNEIQGEVIEVGIYDLELTSRIMSIIVHRGCIAGEIISNQNVETVNIVGREFVVRNGGFGQGFHESKATHSVSIPWDLGQQLKKSFCRHCGKSLD